MTITQPEIDQAQVGAFAGRGDPTLAALSVVIGAVLAAIVIQLAIHLTFKDTVITIFGRRRKIDRKAAQAPVVLGPLALALECVNEHVALIVHGRGEQHRVSIQAGGVAKSDR